MLQKLFITCLLFYSLTILSQNANIPANLQTQIESLKSQAETAENNGNKNDAAKFYNKIAFIYWENNANNEAIEYFNKSLNLNTAIGNNFAIKEINSYLGQIYNDMRQYDKSMAAYQNALTYAKKLQNKKDIAAIYNNMALVQVNQKKYTESNEYALQSLKIAEELYDFKMMKSGYLLVSENYKKLGNTVEAAKYFELYNTFDKKQLEDQTKATLSEMEAKKQAAEIERLKKEKELLEQSNLLQLTEKSLDSTLKLTSEQKLQIDLLHKNNEIKELKVKEQQAQLRSERIILYFSGAGFILVIILAIVLYRGYRQKQKANILLAEQNDEIIIQRNSIELKSIELEKAISQIQEQNIKITDSINYAQRIQQAMLPSEANIQRYLPDSFIFFRPREIVSGDFYWLYRLDTFDNKVFTHNEETEKEHTSDDVKANTNLILAAVDCTGHGVPGAFMSMIGYNLLNAILNKGVREADQILNELHLAVRYALKQHKNDNRDGMDIALTIIHKDKKTVEFAGAKSPLIYIQNNELFTIMGDATPIGGLQREQKRVFTKHFVKYDVPTTFYIFSDGYHDQFGGSIGKKFMSANFKKLLLDIHQKPFAEQKMLLEKNINEWMGEHHPQTDDMLVIGFKLA